MFRTTLCEFTHRSRIIKIVKNTSYLRGVQAYRFGKNDFKLEVRGKGQDTLRVVLGPCVQYCPFEASTQKMGQTKRKKYQLLLPFVIPFVLENKHLKKTSKLDEK